jgi:hypothetical protein
LRVSAGKSLLTLYGVGVAIRLHFHHEIVQGLPRVLCSFEGYCCHLDCLGASGLNIVRALRPPELLVGEDDSDCCESQTKDADDQCGDPVLALDRRHSDGAGVSGLMS